MQLLLCGKKFGENLKRVKIALNKSEYNGGSKLILVSEQGLTKFILNCKLMKKELVQNIKRNLIKNEIGSILDLGEVNIFDAEDKVVVGVKSVEDNVEQVEVVESVVIDEIDESVVIDEPDSLMNIDFENVQVRIIKYDGDYYFVGSDIAEMLGYTKIDKCLQLARDKYKKHFTKDELEKLDKGCSGTPNQSTRTFNNYGHVCITEPGVWQILTTTSSAKAIRFQDKLNEEILPTLRTTGTYTIPNYPKEKVVAKKENEYLSNEEAAKKLLQIRIEVADILDVPKHLGINHAVNEVYNKTEINYKPLLLDSKSFNNLSESEVYQSPTDLGKIYGITPNAVNKFLREILY